MRRYLFVIFMIVYLTLVESTCTPPTRYYIDCISLKSLSTSIQTCNQYGMTLVNLTNSSTVITDVATLNSSLVSINCTSNFWFASGNTTGYVASVATLGNVLASLLGGLGLVLGAVLNLLSCLLFFCPVTTTPAPITTAVIVCVRPIQQQVIQKCQLTSLQSNMRIFKFQEQPMYGGILQSFTLNTRTACSGLCSNNNQCAGISYINGICNLYI